MSADLINVDPNSVAPTNANWSLRGRLLRRVVIGIGASWLLGLALSLAVLNHEMGELMDDSLRASARFSLALYQSAGAVDLPAQDGDYTTRVMRDGVEITGAAWPVQSENGGHDVDGWRVYRLSDPASGISVEVGQSDAWRREELIESIGWLSLMMLPLSLIVVVIIARAVASALRPATDFADRLQARKPGDLSPVAAGDLPRELVAIPRAMNLYLDRIRDHVEAERQFATHAAHELRTPIAAASAQAQVIAAGMGDGDSAPRMVAALRRLSQLVDRLLQLSRAEMIGAGQGSSDLVQVTRMVIADTGVAAVFDDGDIEAAQVPVQPESLALILGNLLRNAQDHGTGDIRVRLRPGPVLTVSNRVAPGATFHLRNFEKSTQSRGTGLGLGIVQKIAGKDGIALEFTVTGDRAEAILRF